MSAQQDGMTRTELLKASPPMFESRLLDACSRVHPSVPVILFLPAIVALLVIGLGRAGMLAGLALAVAGYVFWTLTEYWMHRVVFHFEPEEGIGAKLHWIIHGVHHDHPNDRMRLVMPPSVSVPLALLFLGLFWLVLGSWAAPARARSSTGKKRRPRCRATCRASWCCAKARSPASGPAHRSKAG